MTTAAAPVEVTLRDYGVVVGAGLLPTLGDLVRERCPAHRYALVTDDVVFGLHAERALASFGADRPTVHTMPSGEQFKTRATWGELTDALLAAGHGRDSAVIALGGGVVGDMAGFVAATFMRGIPYVQVPTTLLAMVDASIGGKTGVDTPAGKNLVGAFHQPRVVVADPEVLRTLPPAQLRAGLAESVKHCVIADADWFARIAERGPGLLAGAAAGEWDAAEWAALVLHSVRIKAAVVERDEREGGLRKTLNFGHTIGHAVELLSGFRLLHGEAVAIGMVLEAELAERVGECEAGTRARLERTLTGLGLPTALPAGQAPEAVLAATRLDKKAREGAAEYALPSRIGAMAAGERGYGVRVPDAVVLQVLSEARA